eukprot:PhM_4_TR5785/c0_g1_i1/m.79641
MILLSASSATSRVLVVSLCIVLFAVFAHPTTRHRTLRSIVWYVVQMNIPHAAEHDNNNMNNDGNSINHHYHHHDLAQAASECLQRNRVNLTAATSSTSSSFFFAPDLEKYGPYQWLWDSCLHTISLCALHRYDIKNGINNNNNHNINNFTSAVQEFSTLMASQHSDGFIPEITFHGKKQLILKGIDLLWGPYNPMRNPKQRFTEITQMPLMAYALRALAENAGSELSSRHLVQRFAPGVLSNLEWWLRERDGDGNGLVSIFHPWESGMDASPLYDPVFGFTAVANQPTPRSLYPHFHVLLYRYRHETPSGVPFDRADMREMMIFDVEDVAVNSVIAAAADVVADLVSMYFPRHQQGTMVQRARNIAKRVSGAILEHLWDKDRRQFISLRNVAPRLAYQRPRKAPLFARTVHTLFPLLMADRALRKDQVMSMLNALRDPLDFGSPYPIPSVSQRDKIKFNPNASALMWRGTTWPTSNWIVLEGLKSYDPVLWGKLRLRWLNMHTKQQKGQQVPFSEYYNPLTGQAYGQQCLGMSTLVVDLL